MRLTVIHTLGARAGTRQDLPGKTVVRLGRDGDNDIVFGREAERGVSGQHAVLEVEGEQVFVADRGSTNGTFVNGHPVQKAPLAPDDIVALGDRHQGPAFRVLFVPPTAVIGSLPQHLLSPAPVVPSPAVAVPKAPEPPAVFEVAPAPKKYGTRTVGLFIQQALAQAGLLKAKGTSKSTSAIEAMVEAKVRASGWRWRAALVATSVLLLLGALAFGLYAWQSRNVEVIQTTEVHYGTAAGGAIAAANRYAVFLLVGRNINGVEEGFCSAFAVSANVLATNAHCVRRAEREFGAVQVLMNSAPGRRYPVVRMVAHPQYQDVGLSADVGLLQTSGQLPQLVTLASTAELAAVQPGVTVFVYGFPGRLSKLDAPEASFAAGDIGRVTNFGLGLGAFADNVLLQHTGLTAGGTSGSPIFNDQGRVIGINSGGFSEDDGRAMAGYSIGMRIDLISGLFALLGAR